MPDLVFLILIPVICLIWIVVVAIFAFVLWKIFTIIFNERRIAARNRTSALLSQEACLVSKRQDIHGGGETFTTMNYYATFEFTNGSREEFRVTGKEHGLLAEGDRGMLQSQGTWYKGFNRIK